jgi:hypothetical protein
VDVYNSFSTLCILCEVFGGGTCGLEGSRRVVEF